MIEQLPAWRIERNNALIALDWSYFRAMARAHNNGIEPEPMVVEAAVHKTRYVCTDIPRDLRLQSKEWLRVRGLDSLNGEPLLPGEFLPC